jgi:hypothetical protein
MIAFSIILFAFAVLSFMLGWADGVRHDREILHIHQTGSWLVVCAVLIAAGIACLVWGKSTKRS